MKGQPLPPPSADPYLDWALATYFAGLVPTGSGLRVPLLVRRRADQSWSDLQAVLPQGACLGARTGGSGLLGTVWLDSHEVADQAAAVQAQVAATQLAQAMDAGPVRPPAACAARPSPEVKVVVGVVDRGGAFLNHAFRTPQGRTRLLAYWDQAVRAAPAAHPLGWRLPAEGYGRELLGPALQKLCEQAASAQQERQIYRALGLHELVEAADAEAPDHATHVLDTLAGPASAWPPGHSAKPTEADWAAQAPVVLVSVPSVRPDQSTGAPPVAQIFEAVQYIPAHAQALNPQAAVVINLSLGMQAGPHDGGLLIEQAFDELMQQHPQLLLVLPAGNLDGPALNAGGELKPGGQADVGWRLLPGDPTDSFLELWCWGAEQACASLELELHTPSGATLGPVRPGQALELRDARQQLLLRLCLQQPAPPDAPNGVWRGHALLAMAPTLAASRGGSAAGVWRLICRRPSEPGDALRLSLWVQGDQPVVSRGDSVQSHLEQARGLRLGADGGLNALASGHYPLVVGASAWLEGRAADYSAELLRRDSGAHPAVHLLAAADASSAEPGLLAAGVLSGHWARMNGTSVAAPVVARHWVNWLWEHGLPEPPLLGAPALRWRHTVRAAALQRRGKVARGGGLAAPAARPLRLELRPGRLAPRWV